MDRRRAAPRQTLHLYDEQDPSRSRIKAKIKVASVNTGNDMRDGVGSWAVDAVVGSEVQIEILLEAHRK